MSSRNLMTVRTIQGPPGPPGPMGEPGPSNISLVKPEPIMYITQGEEITFVENIPLYHDLYIKNNTPNSGTTMNFIRCAEHISVVGNCDTSYNYNAFSNINELTVQNPNQVPYTPFSYYYEINKNKLRFSCFDNWKWNLDMTETNIQFKDIYLYPINKVVAVYQYSYYNPVSGGPSPRYSYRNGNDMFIRLPLTSNCYVGQEFNFYICRKVKNIYDKGTFGICEKNQPDCDCDDETYPPSSYKALLHQLSVNIYIFACDKIVNTSYISNNDNGDDLILNGPRVLKNSDNTYFFLALDNETYSDEKLSLCNNFSLNPNPMFDYYHVNIKTVWFNNKKRFLVTTPLPPYTDTYQTQDTMMPIVCNEQGPYNNGQPVNGIF